MGEPSYITAGPRATATAAIAIRPPFRAGILVAPTNSFRRVLIVCPILLRSSTATHSLTALFQFRVSKQLSPNTPKPTFRFLTQQLFAFRRSCPRVSLISSDSVLPSMFANGISRLGRFRDFFAVTQTSTSAHSRPLLVVPCSDRRLLRQLSVRYWDVDGAC